jgi:hypothetical protein
MMSDTEALIPEVLPEDYTPEQALARLETQLTGQEVIERIADAIRTYAYVLDEDEALLIASAAALDLKPLVAPRTDYVRGYSMMEQLADLEAKIKKHYEPVAKPLAVIDRVVTECRKPVLDQVGEVRKAISKRLGTWNSEQERADRLETQRRQAAADAATRAAAQEKADALRRIAEQEENPQIADSLKRDAAEVDSRAGSMHAAPVTPTVNTPDIGPVKKYWKASIVDVRELMRAWLDGKCYLDEDAIRAGLQKSMDVQADAHGEHVTKAFPGVRAVEDSRAASRPASRR